LEPARTALDGDAAVLARLVLAEFRQMREIDPDVAAHEQVEAAVAIVVGEPAARRPAAAAHARLRGDVGKRAVVVVAIEMIAAEGRDVDVLPSVSVDIGGADTH